MSDFVWQSSNSVTRLLSDYQNFIWCRFLAPFQRTLNILVLRSFQQAFSSLSSTFLQGRPLDSAATPQLNSFSLLSKKKSLLAVMRRFTLGTQARGIRLHFHEVTSMLDHADRARAIEHPIITASRSLEPHWKHSFTQLSAAIDLWGLPTAATRLVNYRRNMMGWIRAVAETLQPIRRQMQDAMPYTSTFVAKHIHVPLLYVLLKCTGYSNPDFAFRFWAGAPLVGHFASSALTQRNCLSGILSDDRMIQIAEENERRERFLKDDLSPEAAIKSAKKMRKEFQTECLVGPFRSRRELFDAMEAEIRKNPGLSTFVLDRRKCIVSPQFVVEESHVYDEEAGKMDVKVRNIWNGKLMNRLCAASATYIPNCHGDISAIVLNWLTILEQAAIDSMTQNEPPVPGLANMVGWPADFSGAYRQMPLSVLHLMFSGTAYYDHDLREVRYAYYRALPFGSSIAPAAWSETVVALAHIMSYALLVIITHCIDDIANCEVMDTVDSARDAFLELCELIGLVLDPDKSKLPSANFVYLGLKMMLPAAIPHSYFSLSIPEIRRNRLIDYIEKIFDRNSLTPAEAASMRGRLFFYAYWYQEARSFLGALSQRQYEDCKRLDKLGWPLSPELIESFVYFRQLLDSPDFIKGIMPELFFNREQLVVYTDGSFTDLMRGIGGVFFPKHGQPLYYGMKIQDDGYFPHIAVVEMRAVLEAIEVFSVQLKGSASLFFIDNTHAMGCLLKRSSSLKINIGDEKKHHWVSPVEEFADLSDDIKASMNDLAREIWKRLTKYNILAWFEYVNTKWNISDPPSRGMIPPCGGQRVGNSDWKLVPFQEKDDN